MSRREPCSETAFAVRWRRQEVVELLKHVRESLQQEHRLVLVMEPVHVGVGNGTASFTVGPTDCDLQSSLLSLVAVPGLGSLVTLGETPSGMAESVAAVSRASLGFSPEATAERLVELSIQGHLRLAHDRFQLLKTTVAMPRSHVGDQVVDILDRAGKLCSEMAVRQATAQDAAELASLLESAADSRELFQWQPLPWDNWAAAVLSGVLPLLVPLVAAAREFCGREE